MAFQAHPEIIHDGSAKSKPCLLPQMDAVGSQAGMRMPSWMPQMPSENGPTAAAGSKTIKQ